MGKTFVKTQRGYSQPEATTGLPDYLNNYTFIILWPPRDFIKLIGMAAGHHSSLWLKVTMFDKSQRGY